MKITKYILIGVGFIICILTYCAIYLPPGELTLDDCLEFGICAEGLAFMFGNIAIYSATWMLLAL